MRATRSSKFHTFVLTLMAVVLLPGTALAEVKRDRPRHILLLMCDQYRYDALGCLGNPLAITPNLDRLAERGTLFTRTYCQNPVCVPSRTSMLLGRYCHSTGVFANRDRAPRDQTSFTQVLRKNGYLTACFGKLHVAGRDELDWDEYQFRREHPVALPGKPEPLTGGWPAGKRLGQPAPFEDKYHHEINARDDTIEFIKKNKDRPWFVQCSFVKPHNPFQPPQRYWDRIDRARIVVPVYPADDPEDSNPTLWERLSRSRLNEVSEETVIDAIQGYYGSVNFCDELFGEVIATLDSLGIREDTLIIFTSDHGEMLYDHRLWAKFNFFEQSVHVPLILSWPGKLKEGQTYEGLTELVDLYPTMMELLGFEIPPSVEGRSFAAGLLGKSKKHRAVARSEHKNGMAMEFDGRYKFILNGPDIGSELYDLQSDPREITNLAEKPEFQERVEDWTRRLEEWQGEDDSGG